MENLKRLSRKEFIGNENHIKAEKRVARSISLHSHDYFEIELILNGGGSQLINSEEHELSRGSIYLLTPADFHEVKLSKDTELWNISFDETALGENIKEKLFACKTLCRKVDPDLLFRLERTLELVVAELSSSGNVAPLLEYLLSLVLPDENKKEQFTPIKRAVLYIENHFREDPSLAETARQVGFSPVYFGNLFKKATGETYVNYLNKCKVNCASMLLQNGVTVSHACFESGFGSLSGFLYTFKKLTGVSPREYRDSFFTSSR